MTHQNFTKTDYHLSSSKNLTMTHYIPIPPRKTLQHQQVLHSISLPEIKIPQQPSTTYDHPQKLNKRRQSTTTINHEANKAPERPTTTQETHTTRT